MRLWLSAFVAGVVAAMLVAGFPASAADQTVTAEGSTDWNPNSLAIDPGDTVTWQNPLTGGEHNVCVSKGVAQGVCDEYKSGDPQLPAQWPAAGYSHTFNTAGTYVFECTLHTNMTGTIVVGGGTTTTSTTNTTSTTTTTQTQTQTQTNPTQTQTSPTQTTAADTTPPGFTGKLRRRANRLSIVIELGSSEDATLQATVFRRAPRAHSFTRLGQASRGVHAGRNVVTLPRRAAGRLRSGAYRVRLVLVDAAGNRSRTRFLIFKIA